MSTQINPVGRAEILRDLESEELLQELMLESCRLSPYWRSPKRKKKQKDSKTENEP